MGGESEVSSVYFQIDPARLVPSLTRDFRRETVVGFVG